MNIIKLELTEQEAKIYDEVMERIDETAELAERTSIQSAYQL